MVPIDLLIEIAVIGVGMFLVRKHVTRPAGTIINVILAIVILVLILRVLGVTKF